MKKKVRIYKAPDGNGKYINKTAQFLNRMDYGGQPSIDELGYPGSQQQTQVTTEDQLMQMVYQDISNDMPYEAIVAKLVNGFNLDPAVANQFVQQVYATIENKIDQDKSDEAEAEDEAKPAEVEEVENQIINEKKPMSKIKGHSDLAMEDGDEDEEGLGDEDMLKYGGMPKMADGGEDDYVEAMNNDEMKWPAAETPIVMPDVSEYIPFDISDYLSNDASDIAWQEPTDETSQYTEGTSDYTEPVANPEEFRMGGFKTKKGYVNSILKLVKKANGGDNQEQDIKASDADPRGDDLRKNRLDAFIGSVKKEGDVAIAKEIAEKQFEEMQAMHNQMMMQNPNLQNFIPEDYDEQDYMQYGGQRRAMRQLNRAMRRMPMGIPGMYGPITKFDVRRSGIFGRPKEYSIEFGDSPLMQLAGNPFLSHAYGYGYTKKKITTPARMITETVRNAVNNKSTKDVANATGSEAAAKSAWDQDQNSIPDSIQSNVIESKIKNRTPGFITDPIGTAVAASKAATPVSNANVPGFITDPIGTAVTASKTATPVAKPTITPTAKSVPNVPIVMSQPAPVEENKNTTPGGTEWTVTKKETAPQQEFCYGNQCFTFPDEQYDDALLFNEMPHILSRHQYNVNPNVEWYNRDKDQFDFSKLSPKEIEDLINSDQGTSMKDIRSRNRTNIPSFAKAWYEYQLNNQKAFGQPYFKSTKEDPSDINNPATSKYADFLNQYGRFKPGADPNDIFQAVGPSYPGYENYQQGGLVDNPMPDQFGNLQQFVYGGLDQSDIDDTNSIDVTDPYMPKAQYGNMGAYLFNTYFPANFPQRYSYSKMIKGPYNRTTGQHFANIPGFNPYAQVQSITGKGRRYTVNYTTNPSGRPEDRKLAYRDSSVSQQEQQKQQGKANKSTEPKAGFSNTEGLSLNARRQIRQGEREMMRNDRRAERNPEGKVPFMINTPGSSNQDNLGFGTRMKVLGSKLSGAGQMQYGGYIPEALYGTESPVTMANSPTNSDLRMPTKSAKEVSQQLMMDSRKKLEGEANYMPEEYSVDYKAKNKWLGDRQGAILSANAAAERLTGWINRAQNKKREAKMYENLTSNNLFATDPSRDRGDYVITGSDIGLYRPDEQGQMWGSRSAKLGGNSNYSEGDVLDMTEEELAEFLANGGEVEYINY